MQKINVPRFSGFAVLDGKHSLGGPLDIPAGGFGEISFDVHAGDDLGFLSVNRELSPQGSCDHLHTVLVNTNGSTLASSDEVSSNAPIIRFDTDTKSKFVTKVAPGNYTFRVSDKNGAAHHGVVFSLLQTFPH